MENNEKPHQNFLIEIFKEVSIEEIYECFLQKINNK